jgi:hypothetical protein
MAGTGAVLSLHAIGKQDEYLSDLKGDPKNSFWNYKPVQHTNFSLYYRSLSAFPNTPGDQSWPFGQTVNFTLDPKTSGDVLANAFLKFTLPGLTPPAQYCDQVGQALIKEYSFRVGDTVIQTMPGDWGIIHDELYSELTEQYAHRFMFNAGQALGTLPSSGKAANPIPIYLPLNFFFSRYSTVLPGNWYNNASVSPESELDSSFKPYFMLCACTQQKITITVTFNPITYFSNAGAVSLTKVQLVTEEASLSPEEVNFYRNNRQTYVYNTVAKQPRLRLDKGEGVKNSTGSIPSGSTLEFRNFLVTSIPVKAMHWFFRDQRYEDSSSNVHFLNRFNFCTSPTATPSQEFTNQVMKYATIRLNGNESLTLLNGAPGDYYKYVQSDIHKFTTPKRNIYTYSFSLKPRDPNPTGSLNFSIMESSKTVLEGRLKNEGTSNSYNMDMFYLGYIAIKYEHDFCSLVFS